MMRAILLVAPFLLAAWVGVTPTGARGCAPAPRAGERVGLSSETAFIIWDEANDFEHFIRQATFTGTARDFGFLVPTPSRPQIAPADPDIFRELARITEPKTEHRTETGLSFGCSGDQSSQGDTGTVGAEPGGLIVLEQKRIGNLDAAVLAFRADKTRKIEDTADELLDWLRSRNYAVSADLTAWLTPYIDRKWIITAFKITGQSAEAPPAGSSLMVKSSAVRLSFKTDRPFFPYREPADQRDSQSSARPRTLRVYLAAKERMAGRVGESMEWPGRTVWAGTIAQAQRTALLDKLKLPPETAAGKWWITEFEDQASPRPGTDDLYFDQSMDRGTVARAPILVTMRKTPWWAGPLAIILLVMLGGAGLMIVRRYTGSTQEELPADTPPPLPEHGGTKTGQKPPGAHPRPWS